jgi:hypothetical protein
MARRCLMPLLPFSRKCQKDKFSDQILALIRLAGEWAALALFLELYAAAREVQTPSAQMRYVCVLPETFCKSKDRSEQIFYNPADPFGLKCDDVASRSRCMPIISFVLL